MHIFNEALLFIFFQDLSDSTDFLFISSCCNDVWEWDMYKFPSGACAIPHTRSHLRARVLACSSVGAQVRPVSPAADLRLTCTLYAYGKTAEGSCQTKCRSPIASRCCVEIHPTKTERERDDAVYDALLASPWTANKFVFMCPEVAKLWHLKVKWQHSPFNFCIHLLV